MTAPASSLLAVLPGASASPTGAGVATGDVGGGVFDGLLASLVAGPGEGGVTMPGTKSAARAGRPDSDRASAEDLALDAAAAQMLLVAPGATPIIYAPTVPLTTAGMSTAGAPVQGGETAGGAMVPAPAIAAAGLAPTPPAAAPTAGSPASPAGVPTSAVAAASAVVPGGADNAIIVTPTPTPALTVGTLATAATPGRAAAAAADAVPGAPRDGQAARPGAAPTPVVRTAEAFAPAEMAADSAPAGQAAPAAVGAEAPIVRSPAPAAAVAQSSVAQPIVAPSTIVPPAPPAPPAPPVAQAAAAVVSGLAPVAETVAATAPAGVAPVRDPAATVVAARLDNGRRPAGAERGGRTADSAAAPAAASSRGPALVPPSDGPLAGLDGNSDSPLAAADPLTADAADAGDDRAPVLPADLRAAGSQPTIPDPAPAARGAPETVARLAADIVRKLEGQSTRFDLQLDPHGLGKVDVAIEIDRNGKLTAALSFDSPQTAADLRGRAGELRLALEQAGFDVPENSLTFDTAGQGAGSGGRETGQQQDRAWNGRAFQRVQSGLDEADLTLAATPNNLARRTRSGVDIRI